MELDCEEVAFLHDVMADIEHDDSRLTSERRQAAVLRRKSAAVLTEPESESDTDAAAPTREPTLVQ